MAHKVSDKEKAYREYHSDPQAVARKQKKYLEAIDFIEGFNSFETGYFSRGLLDASTPQNLGDLSLDELKRRLRITPGRMYVMTVTLNRKWHHLDIINQYKTTYDKLLAYCNRSRYGIYMVPEINQSGILHWHGIVNITSPKRDPEMNMYDIDRRIRLFVGYLKRNYGRSVCYAQILSLYDEYKEENNFRRQRTTSFRSIYTYIHKELYTITQLRVLKNLLH